MGGFSGPAIFPVALRMVYQVAVRPSPSPSSAMGGIASAPGRHRDDAGRGLRRPGGRRTTSVDPYACRNIIDELPGVMEASIRVIMQPVKDIIGRSHAHE